MLWAAEGKIKMNRLIATGLILSMLLLGACDVVNISFGSSSTPSGEQQLPLIQIIPTPSKPDRATITGVLQVNPSAPRPAAGVILYLAQIHREGNKPPQIASFERTSPLRTQTDSVGRFVFTDVPPNQYGLVMDIIDYAILLKDPKADKDFLFDAVAGKILDLGTLTYSKLPGFN